MIMVIEHKAHADHGAVTELHCPALKSLAVGQALRRFTGEPPVAVPLCACTVAYFARGISVEEACAVLRLVLCHGEPPEKITQETVHCEILLGYLEPCPARYTHSPCAECQKLRNSSRCPKL